MPVINFPAQVEGDTEGEECEEEDQEVKDSSDPAPVETSCRSIQELRLEEHELLKEEEPLEDKEGEDGDSRSPQGEISLISCHMSIL